MTGETGTGKELVARALHVLSPRRERPFVVINCAAIPEPLLEAELFGYNRGAFTGAFQSRMGRIQMAHGGTVLLDEVGDLPLSMQAKFLRFLQEGEVQRLGSSDALRIDARVIAATNANLPRLVKEGRFRDDLYYRLAVFPVEIDPLRLRREDIGPLSERFLELFSQEAHTHCQELFTVRRYGPSNSIHGRGMSANSAGHRAGFHPGRRTAGTSARTFPLGIVGDCLLRKILEPRPKVGQPVLPRLIAMQTLPVDRQKKLAPQSGSTRSSRRALAAAFASFTQTAGSLETTYTKLQGEVGRLRHELEDKNRSLAQSVEENQRMRTYLARIVEGLPCGVLVFDGGMNLRMINPAASRLLNAGSEELLVARVFGATPSGIFTRLRFPGEQFRPGAGVGCRRFARRAHARRNARLLPGERIGRRLHPHPARSDGGQAA